MYRNKLFFFITMQHKYSTIYPFRVGGHLSWHLPAFLCISFGGKKNSSLSMFPASDLLGFNMQYQFSKWLHPLHSYQLYISFNCCTLLLLLFLSCCFLVKALFCVFWCMITVQFAFPNDEYGSTFVRVYWALGLFW